MSWLRRRFRTRYRIVETGDYFAIDHWRWWWPFWVEADNTLYQTVEEAYRTLRERERFGRVVCYVDPLP